MSIGVLHTADLKDAENRFDRTIEHWQNCGPSAYQGPNYCYECGQLSDDAKQVVDFANAACTRAPNCQPQLLRGICDDCQRLSKPR